MSEGGSLEEVAAKLGICFDTLSEWRKTNEEFSVAIKKGIELSKAWWLSKGRELYNTKFNSTLWYMNMKNRFGWADKQEVKHEGTLKIDYSEILKAHGVALRKPKQIKE